MSYYLRSQGINCSINLQYRAPKLAHRWSTAFSICNGDIDLGTLRQRLDGRDDDGNIWLSPDWDCAKNAQASAASCPLVLSNARKLAAPGVAYAREGYQSRNSRRWPNRVDIPVSDHVYGTAIDLNVAWSRLGDPWSKEANTLIERFGLFRPYKDEAWHVEVDKTKRPDYSLKELFSWIFHNQA